MPEVGSGPRSFAAAVQHARVGRDDQARALCEQILAEAPEVASARGLLLILDDRDSDEVPWLEQGRLCLSLGRLDRASELLERALEIDPDRATAHALLGTAHRLRGEASAASRCYEAALRLDPEEPQARVGQAVILWQRGNHPTALDRLRRLVADDPENLDAQLALGDLLYDRGDYIGAVKHLGSLLDRHPEVPGFRQSLARCLSRKPVAVLALEDGRHVEESYAVEDVEIDHLAQASTVLLLRRPSLAPLWNLSSAEDCGRALRRGELREVLADDFLHQVLRSCILADLRVERALTWLRRAVLGSLTEAADPPSSLVETAGSLALCSWLNEFLFEVSQEERACLDALQARADSPAALLAIAMYAQLPRAELPEQPWPVLEQLVQLHLVEPAQERDLAAELPSLTEIVDDTSAAVSRQYEENPYPRWRSLTRTTRTRMAHGLQALFPHWRAPSFLERPRLLVAGCGTGRDLLTLASTWDVAQATGVDLSRTSLAYAQRMARRLGVDNVALHQADLLALADWSARFDAISCTGVLHHLEDPVAGWRVLVKLLRPGGVMKVALYSERGRQAFVAAQELVQSLGLPPTAEGIRAARRRLIELPPEHPAWGTTTVRDFYYLSGCRDLLFHVKEHRFSLARIHELLGELGLIFLGLETTGQTRLRYDALFGHDPERTSLVCWEKFEELYPETFLTMYQFWCQKGL